MKPFTWKRAMKDFRLRWTSMRDVFTEIYRTKGFGPSESVSGPGSDLVQTAAIRDAIPLLLKEFRVTSLLDAPCGDFHWMRVVELGVERYVGVDVVPEIIALNRQRDAHPTRSFLCADITTDPLPTVDLIFCRDCLVHLSFRDALAVIKNFKRSGSRYLLTTTFARLASHADIVKGRWRPLNLRLPPFRFPPPLRLIDERCTEEDGLSVDKSLGLWRLDDLLVA